MRRSPSTSVRLVGGQLDRESLLAREGQHAEEVPWAGHPHDLVCIGGHDRGLTRLGGCQEPVQAIIPIRRSGN
jgi:hypothetical protein